MHLIRRFVVSAFALLSIACASYAQVERPEVAVAQDVPAAVRSAAFVAPANPFQLLNIAVTLPFRDPAGIQTFVDDVSDPSSPNYRKFLTPEQVGQRFGQSPETLAGIRNYLESYGFRTTLVAKNGISVMAFATVAQAERAFGTSINRYARMTPMGTDEFYSNATNIGLPARFSSIVLNVSGLDNSVKPRMRALTSNQTKSLYSLTNSYTGGGMGLGRKVGISNFDGFDLTNVPLFYAKMGLPSPAGGVGSNVHVVTVGSGSQSTKQNSEGDLDIQMVLSMAPLCDLYVYDGGPTDILQVLTQEVNDNVADVISESYGWGFNSTASANAAHQLHQSMSAQGITYMAASGDTGTTIEPYSYPNYDPEVLMVGGTIASVNSSGNRTSEIGWSGSGGGWATDAVAAAVSFNKLPAYQKGTGVPTNVNKRLGPDIALHAAGTSGGAYQFYFQGALSGAYAGTSFSSPVFAGGLATAEQALIAAGGLPADGSGHRRFGRIQDLIYSQNGRADVWFDVLTGSSGTLPDGSEATAHQGWDFVTGWGAINFDAFVNSQLAIVAINTVTLSPSTVTGGQSSTGTVTLQVSALEDTTVALSSNNSNAQVPASVTVLKGSNTVSFNVTTSAVAGNTNATITAVAGLSTKTATLTIAPPRVSKIAFSPSTVVGGTASLLTITLTAPAPSGGFKVSLSSSSKSVIAPSSVTVPSGQSSMQISVGTVGVGANTSVTLTATGGGGMTTATLNLTAPGVASVTFNPQAVAGGKNSIGTVTISGVAPSSGVSVSLSSGNTLVKVPSSVTVPSGKSSVTFTASTSAVSKDTDVHVTGRANGTTVDSVLTVQTARISSVVVNSASVVGGQSLTGTVQLSTNAPSTGAIVTLAVDNGVASVPATVKVNGGSASATFKVLSIVTAKDVSVNLTATYGQAVKTTFTVLSPAISSVSANPSSVKGGNSIAVTVSIGTAAPNGGYPVNIQIDSIGTVTTVSVPSGKKSVVVSIPTNPVADDTPSVVSAKAQSGAAKATTKITILAPVAKFALSPTTVKGGNASVGTITLDGPAPAGFTWALAAATPAKVDSSVTFVAGAKTITFPVSSSVVTKRSTVSVSVSRKTKKFSANLTVTP